MERQTVISSNIASIGYNKVSQTLEIEFLNGSLYEYYDIPDNIYDELMSADSQGKYLAQKIKKIYKYKQI